MRNTKCDLEPIEGRCIVSAMATKSMDPDRMRDMCAHITKIVDEIGTQKKAEKVLGFSQSHISAIKKTAEGKITGRGPGLNIIEAAADYSVELVDRLLQRKQTDLAVALDYHKYTMDPEVKRAALDELARGVKKTPQEWGIFLKEKRKEFANRPDPESGSDNKPEPTEPHEAGIASIKRGHVASMKDPPNGRYGGKHRRGAR